MLQQYRMDTIPPPQPKPPGQDWKEGDKPHKPEGEGDEEEETKKA